jgi:predicted O-methyltransferase YrrM
MLGTEVESGITREEARLMVELIERERPEATAEIGCANGGSTTVIAQALEQNGKGHHFAVDPFQTSYWKDAGKIRVSAANLAHRVTFHDEYPERVFHTLPQLDFVFIDGSHLFDFTIMDFVVSDRQLKIGGIMAFHDVWMAAVRGALRFVLLNRNYEPLCLAPVGDRLRLSRWRRFRYQAAVAAARWISGESDLVTKRTTFDRLGLDRANLVFIRKTGHDTRDWRFFQEF